MTDSRHPPPTSSLHTTRLLLRPWREEDLHPFAELNADPRVAKYLPSTLTREQSDAMAARIRKGFEDRGFGFWAVERIDRPEHPFVGFVGLSVPRFSAHFTPCVEIGWRLSAEHWGQGLATEGAVAVLGYAFNALLLEEVVSFTVPENLASRRIMEKIGMHRNPPDDFDHPSLPQGHRLQRHVLYRLERPGGTKRE